MKKEFKQGIVSDHKYKYKLLKD